MNSRLGNENVVANVKGHSGRRSFITNSLSAGVPPEIVAQSTKHKDPKTLMSYAEKSDAILGSAGLQMNKRLKPDSGDVFGGHSISSISKSHARSSESSFVDGGAFSETWSSSLALAANSSSSSSASIAKQSERSEEGSEKKSYTFNFSFH